MSLDKSGVALYSHLKSVETQTGTTPPELVEYESLSFCPSLALYWEDFLSLSKRRTRNEGGSNPITYPEICAWASLNALVVSPTHLEIIERLDAVWMRVDSKKNA